MEDFRIRMSVSQQGDRSRPFFSRQQLHRSQVQTSYNKKRSDEIKSNNKLDQPGLYFDANQVKDVIQFQNPLINRTQSQQSIRAKSGFAFSEKSQKLYSPYEYLHYATKVSGSKEQYLNALQQLGYDQAQTFQARPLNEIVNNTNQIINKSYSIKYMGIIDGNMGILSNRKVIANKQTSRLSQQLQPVEQQGEEIKHTTNHFKYTINHTEDAQDYENYNSYHNQQNKLLNNDEPAAVVQQVSLDNKYFGMKQVANPVTPTIPQNTSAPQRIQTKQNHIQNPMQTTTENMQTINSQPNIVPQTSSTELKPQKTPHPENYSTYLVGKYSLPRGLRSLKKMRDPTILEQKLKLEQWHAEKIKVFEVSDQFGGGFSIQSSIPNKSSSNFFPHQTLQGQTKQSLMRPNTQMTSSQQQSGNARMKSSLYKKPLQNYEENAEEGICYAIIEQNPNSDVASYSKLLQHIDQMDPQQVLPRVLSANQMAKHKQKPPGVSYEQNMQLFERYQQLETKTFIRAASPNKYIPIPQQ